MINGEWWYERRAKIGDLIEEFKDHPDLVKFLKDEKDRNCQKCKYWQNYGSYDSGAIGNCAQPKLTGTNHHPSNGCGTHEMTMMYMPNLNQNQKQEINTRWNFSCALWERADEK